MVIDEKALVSRPKLACVRVVFSQGTVSHLRKKKLLMILRELIRQYKPQRMILHGYQEYELPWIERVTLFIVNEISIRFWRFIRATQHKTHR